MQQSLHSIGQPQMLLIDLDGTLIDTAPDLALCVDLMMDALDMPVHGEAAVREWIGNGVERLVRRALVGAYEGEPDDALYEKAYPLFLDLYEKNVCSVRCRDILGRGNTMADITRTAGISLWIVWIVPGILIT